MNFELERKWRESTASFKEDFGDQPDVQGMLFLIGVQELGKGIGTFSKDEKMNLMHIAICTILSSYGYYEYEGLDKEGWPHFKKLKDLPSLSTSQQERLLKEAIIEYLAAEIPVD